MPFGDFKVLDKGTTSISSSFTITFLPSPWTSLRPGGVMALVRAKAQWIKNSAVRKYIAQRAELLGAIRLPNNTFKGNAGTEVVSDILICKSVTDS